MNEKKDVKLMEIARRLQGLHTISSVCRRLGVREKTAINYIYELRKRGFVETARGRGNIRLYHIFPVKRKQTGYPGLYDVINKYSPLKIAKPYEHRVYKEMSVEEAIVRALETRDFRAILASMALFRHVKDWSRLYECAKKSEMRRQAGALYDLSKKAMRVRRMDKRIENRLLKAVQKNKYMVPGVRTRDFPDIEKKWKVYIPFTKGDLRRLKE